MLDSTELLLFNMALIGLISSARNSPSMGEFDNQLPESHPLSSWEMFEEDPWTTQYEKGDFQIEIFYIGNDNKNPEEWQLTLYYTGDDRFDRLDVYVFNSIKEGIKRTRQYVSNKEEFL